MTARNMLFCRHGCRRPAQFLCPTAWHRGPAVHRSRHSRALERHPVAARGGNRLSDTLSRPVPRGGRTLPRPDAGDARRDTLAVDAAVDRVLLVHALEMSADPVGLLREAWRVLSGGGRLLAVVPNRRGLWARIDTTPFGQGRPYSRSQITNLLRETWFTPTGWGEALYVPPIPHGWFLRSAVAWERSGAT